MVITTETIMQLFFGCGVVVLGFWLSFYMPEKGAKKDFAKGIAEVGWGENSAPLTPSANEKPRKSQNSLRKQ